MDINSNIPTQKKVSRFEILRTDEPGYGPQMKQTRGEWRQECLDNLLAGKEAFKVWQEKCISQETGSISDWPFPPKPYRFVLNFENHSFENELNLLNYEFLRDVSFKNSMFVASDFLYCKFFEKTDFSDAIFDGQVKFYLTQFFGPTLFKNAIFSAEANFINTLFALDADFFKAKFQEESLFTSTSFNELCNFESVTFENVGHFEQASFAKTPSFRGCKIDSTRLEFTTNYFPTDETTENAIKNISFLKRLADEHGQTDQALNFNAMELRAKRLQTEPQSATRSFKSITWLYEKLSDYGQSVARPLFIYLSLIFFTYLLAILAAANNSPQVCKGELWRVFSDWRNNGWPSCISYELPDDKFNLNGYRAAGVYTLYRAAGILDFSDNGKATDAVARRLFGQSIEPWWMRAWGVFKAIASTALLFLAALGLRNKYRIK